MKTSAEDQSYTNKAFNASEYNVEHRTTGKVLKNIEQGHKDGEAISDNNVTKLNYETNLYEISDHKKKMDVEAHDGITLSAVTLQNFSPKEGKHTQDFEHLKDGSLKMSVNNAGELETESGGLITNITTDDFNTDCDIHDSSSGYSGSTFKRSLSYGDKPKRRKAVITFCVAGDETTTLIQF